MKSMRETTDRFFDTFGRFPNTRSIARATPVLDQMGNDWEAGLFSRAEKSRDDEDGFADWDKGRMIEYEEQAKQRDQTQKQATKEVF